MEPEVSIDIKSEAYSHWYTMGYEDGYKFHHEFNFQPWWSEGILIAYHRGWSDGKEKMIDEVRGKR